MELLLQSGVGIATGMAMGKITLWLISFYRRLSSGKGAKEDTAEATSMISILMIGMMIRRGDRYIVPNGTRRLHPGDILLKEDRDAG